jgi:predicted transcriptional regulator
MTTLTLELPPEVYRRLHEEADRLGKPPQVVVQEWLIERLSVPIPVSGSGEREQARQALRAAGLLVEQRSPLCQHVDQKVRLEDVEAALARVGGKPLSDIVLEQRGPKG